MAIKKDCNCTDPKSAFEYYVATSGEFHEVENSPEVEMNFKMAA
jgi:hypothetical protein